MLRLAICALALCTVACSAPQPAASPTPVTADSTERGRVFTLENVASEHVAPRNVSIYLPAGYDGAQDSYPVIYMHDGQNVFEPGYAYGGKEWQADETLDRLIASGQVRPAIIVAPWNTSARWREYAPQAVVEALPEGLKAAMLAEQGEPLLGNAYLRFLALELKPRIDAEYRTRPGPADTFLMGSSMGGLISLYGVANYPDVFGGAACLSIHWPIEDPRREGALDATDTMVDWLDTTGLDGSDQRIWFDHGTLNLDGFYAPYSQRMEAWFRSVGASPQQVHFEVFEGTDHNEAAWAERLHLPMTFLLGTDG